MKIKNVSATQMEIALMRANYKYDNNLRFNRFDVNSQSIDFTLRVQSSKGPGHRLSHSGRRMVAACWHAHRDFMRAIFDIAPDAVLRSSMAVYRGKAGFEASYPDTGFRNIGSMMSPVNFKDACEC